jgi:surface protein
MCLSAQGFIRRRSMTNLVNPYRFGGVNPNFVLVMATTGAAETVTIPCQNVGTFNATIDWGDETAESTITTFDDADLAHEYASAGDHTIMISGTFPNIFFNNGGDKLKLKGVTNLGQTGLVGMDGAFYGCTNLTSFVSGNTDTSLVESFKSTFEDCSGLTELDLSSWDVSVARLFESTFEGCSGLLTLNLTGWGTPEATTFRTLFRDCSSLTAVDVSGFDASAVANMSGLFRNCGALIALDVSGWDVSTATNMADMFRGCTSLGPVAISGWVVSLVTSATQFMSGANNALTTAEYDAALIAWDALTVQSGTEWHFGDATYTGGGAAEAARTSLVNNDLWDITDGGTA